MFSNLTNLPGQAMKKTDEFISTIVTQASQSAEFELSLSSAAPGTNTANTSGTQTLSSRSGHTTATSAISSMNEATLRSLHAFMLTVTGVDGHELGNAMEVAHEQGRLPASHDRDAYIAEWKELQKDPAFRHDITYDGRAPSPWLSFLHPYGWLVWGWCHGR